MKLFYSVLDRRGHEWKKKLSSILMEKALVDPLDRIFERPRYTENINTEGYIPKIGGFLTDTPDLYNTQVILEDNKRPENERLILITFDGFLGKVELEMLEEEFERKKDGPIEVMIKRPSISIKNMRFIGRHAFSKPVRISDKPKKQPELSVYSGGTTSIESNSSIVSFAHPTPLSILSIYPLPYMLIRHYASTITHELADFLLDGCEDSGKCVKKSIGRNFGEKCKRKLEEIYL